MSFPTTCTHVLSGSKAVEFDSLVTESVVLLELQTSANAWAEPSNILTTDPVPKTVWIPSPPQSLSGKNNVDVPVKSEIRVAMEVAVFVVSRTAV